jgi:hypothetical protein
LTIGALVTADVIDHHTGGTNGWLAFVAVVVAFLPVGAELQTLVAIELAGVGVRGIRRHAEFTLVIANQAVGTVEQAYAVGLQRAEAATRIDNTSSASLVAELVFGAVILANIIAVAETWRRCRHRATRSCRGDGDNI